MLELLIVITIISLLAALLFPALSQAKAAAKKTVCLSNTKQIGLAYIMYANDYDDRMATFSYVDSDVGPPGALYSEVTPLYGFWYTSYSPVEGGSDITKGQIYPYVKNPPVNDCPAASELEDPTGTSPLAYAINREIIEGCDTITEGYVGNGGSCLGYPGPYPAVSFTSVSQPSETIFMTDAAFARWDDTGSHIIGIVRNIGFLSFGSGGNVVHGMHDGVSNVAWLDGHSKGIRTNIELTLRDEEAGESGPDNHVLSSNFMGDIIRPGASIPAGLPNRWFGKPVAASAAYYYLLHK